MVRLATTGQFDLRCPRYNDPVWWKAFDLAVQKVHRDMSYELSQVNLLSSVASAIAMMVESLRNPATTDSQASDFQSRAKVWTSTLSTAHRLGLSSVVGKISDPQTAEEKQLSQAEKAQQAWEKIFGKRGDPVTEAKVAQTTKLFQDKLQAAEEARNKNKRDKRRGRK